MIAYGENSTICLYFRSVKLLSSTMALWSSDTKKEFRFHSHSLIQNFLEEVSEPVEYQVIEVSLHPFLEDCKEFLKTVAALSEGEAHNLNE